MNDISSARMAVARQRPQSTDPTLTVRSYDAKLGTNVHNYWKKSQKKTPAESHAPVALDQAIFNQPGPACDLPSFEQGDISLKPNLSLPKAFPYFWNRTFQFQILTPCCIFFLSGHQLTWGTNIGLMTSMSKAAPMAVCKGPINTHVYRKDYAVEKNVEPKRSVVMKEK